MVLNISAQIKISISIFKLKLKLYKQRNTQKEVSACVLFVYNGLWYQLSSILIQG